jgi:hypothetical protein
MTCFTGVEIWQKEAPFSLFTILPPDRHWVVKRTATCHEHLTELPDSIALIYCIRHPYDCLTSRLPRSNGLRHFHVSEERWSSEYNTLKQLRRFRTKQSFRIIKYEDLINDPDKVQRDIAQWLSLPITHKFSSNPNGINVFKTSIGRWSGDSNFASYLDLLDEHTKQETLSFIKAFGYQAAASTRSHTPASSGYIFPWRLSNNPMVHGKTLGAPNEPGALANINGPSLIKVPDWIPNPLGAYYLYFAHHRGQSIRLAYSDSINGPWRIYSPGTLKRESTPCCGHIASPDVHVMPKTQNILMYFHGPGADNIQRSYVSISQNGIDFTVLPEPIGAPYLKAIFLANICLGMASDGYLYRSIDGLGNFIRSRHRLMDSVDPIISPGNGLRHPAISYLAPYLEIYYSRRGDAPESIRIAKFVSNGSWDEWKLCDDLELLRPTFEWEGANLTIQPSMNGMSHKTENAVRDPSIFYDQGRRYLLYAIGGESGIAISKLRN